MIGTLFNCCRQTLIDHHNKPLTSLLPFISSLNFLPMAFPPHTFMFHTDHPHHEDHHHRHEPLISSSPSLKSFPPLPPHHFQTRSSAPFMVKRSMSCSGIESRCYMEVNGGEDDLSDDGSVQIGEKKKRLNMEQVKALEKSFEVGNKLEPERKLELAKALGLQPRQIAIWFQNRRARWKTKNLEKEYESLKKQFEALKADNDALNLQNQKLHAELQALKGRDHHNSEGGTVSLVKKENEGSWSNNGSENSSDINLDLSRTPVRNSPAVCSQNGNNKSQLVGSNNNNNNLKPTSITQLLQFSTRSDLQDETFSNMFNTTTTIDDHQHHQQQNFWTWPHEQHHHFH